MTGRTPLQEFLEHKEKPVNDLLVCDAEGHLDEPILPYARDSCCLCVGAEICVLMYT